MVSKNTEELSDFRKSKCGNYYYTLDYKQLGALTMKVTQDQQREIESLKKSNFQLQGEVSILKQMLQEIKEELHAKNK